MSVLRGRAAREGGSRNRSSGRLLHSADVRRLQTLVPLLHLELHLLTLLKTAIASHLDGAVVNEHISPTVGLRDEPVTLLGVEPFHRTNRHLGDPLSSCMLLLPTAPACRHLIPRHRPGGTLVASTLVRQWRPTSSPRSGRSTSSSSNCWR